MKLAKTAYLRCRVDNQMRRDLEFLARQQVLDLSDIVRIACHTYVQLQSKGFKRYGRK